MFLQIYEVSIIIFFNTILSSFENVVIYEELPKKSSSSLTQKHISPQIRFFQYHHTSWFLLCLCLQLCKICCFPVSPSIWNYCQCLNPVFVRRHVKWAPRIQDPFLTCFCFSNSQHFYRCIIFWGNTFFCNVFAFFISLLLSIRAIPSKVNFLMTLQTL